MSLDTYKLEKPNLDTVDKTSVFEKFTKNASKLAEKINEVNEPNYYYWDKIKYRQPPENYSITEFWYLVKQIRTAIWRSTPIQAENHEYFKWIRLNYTDEYLHTIDMQLGGQIFTHYSKLITPQNKQRILTKSIIEEAIASSQLEGASTTAPIAKKMILENRPPRDKSERMILNNYQTITALNDDFKNRKLSEEMLFELHRRITKDTLESDKQGRYRTDQDGIVVADDMKYIYFVPPQELFVKEQVKHFINFANDENEKTFIHPIIKAILLHFWVGFLHPFYDGNGRIARTIFYWYLLRKGYWSIMYIPISLVIKKSPSQYGMAFVYAEQDDMDFTYFYDYHMKKFMQALRDFNVYLDKKSEENRLVESKLHSNYMLNDRQKDVVHYLLLRDASAYTSPSSHQTLYEISRTTAIADLKELEKKGLIIGKKEGVYVRYYATDVLKSEH